MKIMGLANWLHWTAWFMNFFTLLTIATILMTILVKIKWYGNDLAVFTHSEGTVIFVFLLLFAVTCITFSFLISTLFSKGKIIYS
jgi:ATP-binding cassette subfamily A (ABC1) protein 3